MPKVTHAGPSNGLPVDDRVAVGPVVVEVDDQAGDQGSAGPLPVPVADGT
jgi:hypothetical protein